MASSRIGARERDADGGRRGRFDRTARATPAAVMDTRDGDELARRIAEELGDALAAPTARPGCSGHHMAFPGTVTVPPETLMEVVRSYCRSLDEHGFRPVVLVPTRGGNFGPVRTVAPDVARELDAAVIPLADRDGRAAADRGTRRGGHRVRPGGHPRRRRRDGGRDGHRRGPRADGGHRAGPRAAGPDRPPAERGARDGPRERRPRRPDRGDPGAGETTTRRVVDAYVDHTEAERQSV